MKRWFLLIILLAGTMLLAACASAFAAEPGADGRIEVVMHDNRYEPQVIRVKAGQPVEIVLRNEGTKLHEFMIGRDPRVEGNWTEGFATDFFTGLDLQIDGPGMVMGLPSGNMEGMDMGGSDEHAATEEGMDMSSESSGMDMSNESSGMDMDNESSGMDMSNESSGMDMDNESSEMNMNNESSGMDMNNESTGMDMNNESSGMDMGQSDEHGADEHGAGDFGEFGAFQISQLEAGHSGVMVMIDPAMIPASETTVIRMTIPADRVGTWTFGCFQERGQHFDDGMHGTFIVEP